MIFIESKMRRKVFHPKTTTNGCHWSTGMGDINRSSPDGVRGLDDNYDKVEQELLGARIISLVAGGTIRTRSEPVNHIS